MAQLFFQPVWQAVDANGAPLSGALLYFYNTGTSTPLTVYQDSGLVTPHAVPVVANTAGMFAPVYVDAAQYKVVLKTSAGVTVQTVDPVSVNGGNTTLESTDSGAAVGPTLTLLRSSTSPAASDIIGRVLWQGKDSTANTQDYAEIDVQIDDATSGSEDATLRVRAAVAGTMTTVLTLTGTLASFTGAGAFTGATPLTLTYTDAGAAVGPTLDLFRDSVSPAASDQIGQIRWRGRDSGGNVQAFAGMYVQIDDPTDASEDATVVIQAQIAGTMTPLAQFGGTATAIKFGNTTSSSNNATLDGYTDWITYTPTFTGFGTCTNIDVWSKRIGDTLYVQGRFRAGTTTATEARISIGFNGTDGNVTIDATKVAALRVSGRIASASTAVTNPYQTLMLGGVGYITLAKADTVNQLTNVNGNIFSSGDIITFTAEIPISGW